MESSQTKLADAQLSAQEEHEKVKQAWRNYVNVVNWKIPRKDFLRR